MKGNDRVLFAAALIASLIASCSGPSSDELRLASEWLETDCVTGTGDSITAAIRATGGNLEPTFITAFKEGPSAAQILRIDSAGRRLYQIVATKIDTTDTVVFPNGAAFLATSMTSFGAVYAKKFDRAFRSRALAALGVIARQPGRAVIDSVALAAPSVYFTQANIIKAELASNPFYRIK